MPRKSRPLPVLLLAPFFTALFIFWLVLHIRGIHINQFWKMLPKPFIYWGLAVLLILPFSVLFMYWLRRMPRKSRPLPVFLLLPFFTALFIFWLVPLFHGFRISLESDELFGEPVFVGLEHYRFLFQDGRFWHALRNTFVYCGLVVAMVPPLSLLLAHWLRRAQPRFRSPIQFCLLLPGLTPPLVLALLYLMVFNGPYGLLNKTFLHPLGLANVDWIRDPNFIKISLAILALWRWTGFITLIFLSGLEGIPKSYYDAARSEGASAWQNFRLVTLPLLRPVTVFVAAFLFLDAFALFEGAYVLLGGSGGTLDAGLLLVSYSYLTAFTLGNFGTAAAMAFTSLPVLMLVLWFILAQGRIQRRWRAPKEPLPV